MNEMELKNETSKVRINDMDSFSSGWSTRRNASKAALSSWCSSKSQMVKIAEIKNEWMRQWARTVLIVERSISPKERLRQQNRLYFLIDDLDFLSSV